MDTIRQGSRGDAVRLWQKIIGVVEDGIFGPATAAATRAWQMSHGLIPDGVVGAKTWAASQGDIAAPNPDAGKLAIKGTDLAFPIQGELKPQTWQALADDGVRFAIMRLQVGNEAWSDARAVEEQLKIARSFGVACSAYLFGYLLPHLDPKKQVEVFVRLLEKLGNLGSNVGDLPPALDVEWPPDFEWKADPDPSKAWPDGTTKRYSADGRVLVDMWKKWKCSPTQIRDWTAAALERGEELTGGPWIVYSYRYYLKIIEAHKLPELSRRPLWLADYKYQSRWVTRGEVATVVPPAPWKKITVVQHDGNGGLRLPNGVDADFNMFNGSDADFDALVGRKDAPTAAPVSVDPILLGQRTREMIVEDQIAAYRRERIDAAT